MTFEWKYKYFETIPEVENSLRTICPNLKDDFQPLLTLMTCQKGRFFLPIFYSLCQILNLCNKVSCLRLLEKMFENRTDENGLIILLLNCLKNNMSNYYLVDSISKKFTFETILYCGFQYGLDSEAIGSYPEILEKRTQYWLECEKEYFATCSTVDKIKESVLRITKICFPVMSTTNDRVKYYVWDPFAETWCLITTNLEIILLGVLNFMWKKTKDFMLQEFQNLKWQEEREILWLSFEPNWSSDAKYWVSLVINSSFKVHSDPCNINRLKQNKFLKTFLEDYECANVPEFYFMEERKFQVEDNL